MHHDQTMPEPAEAVRLRAAGLLLRPVLDTRDVADALRVSPSTVRRMRQRGELPMALLGRKYVITRQALNGLIERRALTTRTEGV